MTNPYKNRKQEAEQAAREMHNKAELAKEAVEMAKQRKRQHEEDKAKAKLIGGIK